MRAHWVCRSIAGAVVAMLSGGMATASTWDHAHGDAGNAGFADMVTRPAVKPVAVLGGMGSFASGVGPVIGPDGTVYLASEQGVLWALHPDGKPFWHRALDRQGEAIQAPPVVDSKTPASIYVVSTYDTTDNRMHPAVRHREPRLYRFVEGGGVLWSSDLPQHEKLADRLQHTTAGGAVHSAVLGGPDHGLATGPLNVLHQGGTTTILFEARYFKSSVLETRLLGFGNDGRLIGDTRIGLLTSDVSGGPDELIDDLTPNTGGFLPKSSRGPGSLPVNIAVPMPGVALNGGDIVATDGFRSVMHVGFNPAKGAADPSQAFTAGPPFKRGGRIMITSSVVQPNGESVAGEADTHEENDEIRIDPGHLLFTGPLQTRAANVDFPITAMPALTADGRIVFAAAGEMKVMNGQTLLATVPYPDDTIAPPAISRNHIFVSTVRSLRSYDAKSLALLAVFDWTGGGVSSPAIGPDGRVYALAGNKFYIWAAPICANAAASPCHAAPHPVVLQTPH